MFLSNYLFIEYANFALFFILYLEQLLRTKHWNSVLYSDGRRFPCRAFDPGRVLQCYSAAALQQNLSFTGRTQLLLPAIVCGTLCDIFIFKRMTIKPLQYFRSHPASHWSLCPSQIRVSPDSRLANGWRHEDTPRSPHPSASPSWRRGQDWLPRYVAFCRIYLEQNIIIIRMFSIHLLCFFGLTMYLSTPAILELRNREWNCQ